jgi:hypothetical protein
MPTINAWGSTDPAQVALGGTGQSTLTAHALLLGNTTSGVNALALTDGQLAIGHTGSDPTAATLTQGAGVTITNGAGSITIASAANIPYGMAWTNVTSASQQAAVNNGYIANNGTLCTVTLPATATIGQGIAVVGNGAGLWKIAQNANQYINIGGVTTSTGVGGSLASNTISDCVFLICTTTNNGWTALSVTGNITYV